MTGNTEKDKKTYTSRVVFVDQTRALAIILMLVGHSLDRFLAEPWRSGDFYTNYQFVRGISSTLFLTISGFSFAVASLKHFDDYLTWSPRMWSRIRRIGLIAFLGYTLNLWQPTLTELLASIDAYKIERFFRFDVLQNIAFSLLFLHGLVWITRDRRKFAVAVFISAVAVFAVAVWTYRPDIDAALHPLLGAMVNMHHSSGFPVVPYTGFLLMGAGFGYLYLIRREKGDEWKVFVGAVMAAVFLIAFEILGCKVIDGGIFPYSARMSKMPGNTFARAGIALLIIGGFYWLGRVRIILPKLSFILSKDTLLIYFVHLIVVYNKSLNQWMGMPDNPFMSPVELAGFIISLSLSMFALAALSNMLRRKRIALHAMARHSMILCGIMSFTVWQALSIPRIALSLTISIAIIIGFNRLKSRFARASMA